MPRFLAAVAGLLKSGCDRTQSRLDLVNVGPDIEAEKDYCLERFMSWASQVCDTLVARGFWADFIDPCSGLPMARAARSLWPSKRCIPLHVWHQTSSAPSQRSKVNGGVYPEVQALSTLLNYRTSNAGCCRVVLHPKWATSVYPASLFAKAPLEELLAAIREAEAKLGGASHEAG